VSRGPKVVPSSEALGDALHTVALFCAAYAQGHPAGTFNVVDLEDSNGNQHGTWRVTVQQIKAGIDAPINGHDPKSSAH
jgi:hypothetical protein